MDARTLTASLMEWPPALLNISIAKEMWVLPAPQAQFPPQGCIKSEPPVWPWVPGQPCHAGRFSGILSKSKPQKQPDLLRLESTDFHGCELLHGNCRMIYIMKV